VTSGCSGTPLARKLGLKAGMRCALIDPPAHYWDLLPDRPDDLSVLNPTAHDLDFVHLFVQARDGLPERLRALRAWIARDGMVWVSWPKKASRVRTDVDEGVVRHAGLAAGLVDVKVCAVDETWSGLKFVIPKTDRV
jgi:hypothetical protein